MALDRAELSQEDAAAVAARLWAALLTLLSRKTRRARIFLLVRFGGGL